MLKPVDKRAVIDWEEFVENMNRDAPVNPNETPAQKKKRIAELEADVRAAGCARLVGMTTPSSLR